MTLRRIKIFDTYCGNQTLMVVNTGMHLPLSPHTVSCITVGRHASLFKKTFKNYFFFLFLPVCHSLHEVQLQPGILILISNYFFISSYKQIDKKGSVKCSM